MSELLKVTLTSTALDRLTENALYIGTDNPVRASGSVAEPKAKAMAIGNQPHLISDVSAPLP